MIFSLPETRETIAAVARATAPASISPRLRLLEASAGLTVPMVASSVANKKSAAPVAKSAVINALTLILAAK